MNKKKRSAASRQGTYTVGVTALVIAIGGTGGHHRSVAGAHELAAYITREGYQVTENHRDISR